MRASCAALICLTACTHAPAKARLSDLDWISGCWESRDHTQFERWMPERDGRRDSASVTYRQDGAAFTEKLWLEQTGTGVTYWALPAGRTEPVAFRLTTLRGTTATFENPHHDDPKRIRYSRQGGTLKAWTGKGGEKRLVLNVRLSGCD
jgi:hypothetical protein